MSMSSDMDIRSGESELMAGPQTGADPMTDSMPMTSDMDMGGDDSGSTAGADTKLHTRPGHSTAMAPQIEGVTETSVRVAKGEMGGRVMLNHSGSLSPCMHEPCSQTSMSVSPSTVDHSQPSSLHWVPTGISNPVNIWTTFHWTRPGTSPPKILAVDHLTTTLRI
jgi:hypothetical protein